MIVIFWVSVFIIFYTYAGYGIVLFLLVKIRQAIKGKRPVYNNLKDLPSVTLIIAAYNEEKIIEEKIQNTLSLTYPADKINYLFVTDGSTDRTPEVVAKYSQIQLMHSSQRSGKINAVHRAMKKVTTEVAIFTDANTFLNKDALVNIARHYADKKVGAVSGEKRVEITEVSDATAGEGFYWKYESALKKLDSQLYSVVGAAGELFSIRTRLYEPVAADTILDDFMISLLIAAKNYRIVYEPDAFALESASANTFEELKRKVRIAAGGIQSILRLRALLNPFKFPVLSFQYISHRVLRWTITPLCMITAFLLNFAILFSPGGYLYNLLFLAQFFIYGAAVLGWAFERKEIKIKAVFIPFYFCMMNYAVLAGMVRFASKKQSAVWDKARRK
ncbi:MAG: glycosyltransferase family 2 protein [Bacteroidota bacterium]|nr:glycosyltransferase family 2 protein [Bacteroidota bacterium]